MSNLNQKIRQTARIDSKRHAKGTICRILHGEQIIDILYRYSLVPQGTLFSTTVPVAMSCNSGRIFVVPNLEYPRLEDELKNLGPLTITKITKENNNNQLDIFSPKNINEAEKLANSYESIVRFLKQNMIMVRIPVSRWPEGTIVDPNKYDILIETIDVGQSLDGVFVDRTLQEY